MDLSHPHHKHSYFNGPFIIFIKYSIKVATVGNCIHVFKVEMLERIAGVLKLASLRKPSNLDAFKPEILEINTFKFSSISKLECFQIESVFKILGGFYFLIFAQTFSIIW